MLYDCQNDQSDFFRAFSQNWEPSCILRLSYSSAALSCRIAVRNCLLDSLVRVNFPQHIIVAGHPDIKGRHQENANHQVGDQAADNDNRKWPLGVRTDGMR